MSRRTSASLGELLRNLREAQGLRLADVAPKIQTDTGSLSRIERGHRDPTLAQLRILARLYGVSAARLFAAPPRRSAA